jgi:signal transduction histidine kinase
MNRLLDRMPDQSEFELVLRRVAHGTRLVGLAWWTALSVVSLVDGERGASNPGWVVVSIVVAVGWGVVTTTLYRRDETLATSRLAVGVDIALAAGSIPVSRILAESDIGLYGGFPILVVVIAAIRSQTTAILAAVILALVSGGTGIVVAITDAGPLTEPVSQVFVYAAGAFIAAWVLATLRRSESAVIEAREELARSEERSRISAHLHDSVLQTLALIQKSSERAADVVGLARRQERELRSWLYGTSEDEGGGLAESLRRAAAEVEERYGVPIDVVAVGDIDRSEVVVPLIQAGREAMVNAAKHSGSASISAFAQVDDGAAAVFVRDRGSGFDRDSVEADRRGIVDSIEGRMRSIGGAAELRTGERGTEWKLEVRL